MSKTGVAALYLCLAVFAKVAIVAIFACGVFVFDASGWWFIPAAVLFLLIPLEISVK